MSNTLGRLCFAGAVVTPAEFQLALEARRKAKLEKPKAVPACPLTDDEVRARIALLGRENAHLREQIEQRQNKEAERMAQEIIKGRQGQPAPKYSAQSNKNRDRYY